MAENIAPKPRWKPTKDPNAKPSEAPQNWRDQIAAAGQPTAEFMAETERLREEEIAKRQRAVGF